MWRAMNPDGTLTYSFVESLSATYPFYAIRLLGGVLVMAGMFVMVWNVYCTVGRRAASLDVAIPLPAAQLAGHAA
jgi:cytochrome c oxidase cbb3-type subunit 1